MFEHSSYIHNSFAVEQERIDRANELRRVIAESPERIVPRERSITRRVRGWLRRRRADAVTTDDARVARDQAARPAHAR